MNRQNADKQNLPPPPHEVNSKREKSSRKVTSRLDDIPKLVYTKYYEGKEYVLIERIGRTPRTPDKERGMHFTTLYKNE